ncbi:MAG: nucleotidyltransferase family protein [Hyphomicrobiaceae bacterium]
MHLDDRHRATVRQIVKTIVPKDVAVLAFGSRVHGRCLKPFSDLDLCLRGVEPVPEATLRLLRAAFEDSDLPFKIDIIDWHGISDEFQAAIEVSLTPLTS